jgi:hypothetical protein
MPVIESGAGMPVRRGFKGGLAGASFGGAGVPVLFLPDERGIDFSLYDARGARHGLNVILVIGCISKIVGMRLFKLFGPGL